MSDIRNVGSQAKYNKSGIVTAQHVVGRATRCCRHLPPRKRPLFEVKIYT